MIPCFDASSAVVGSASPLEPMTLRSELTPGASSSNRAGVPKPPILKIRCLLQQVSVELLALGVHQGQDRCAAAVREAVLPREGDGPDHGDQRLAGAMHLSRSMTLGTIAQRIFATKHRRGHWEAEPTAIHHHKLHQRHGQYCPALIVPGRPRSLANTPKGSAALQCAAGKATSAHASTGWRGRYRRAATQESLLIGVPIDTNQTPAEPKQALQAHLINPGTQVI